MGHPALRQQVHLSVDHRVCLEQSEQLQEIHEQYKHAVDRPLQQGRISGFHDLCQQHQLRHTHRLHSLHYARIEKGNQSGLGTLQALVRRKYTEQYAHIGGELSLQLR